LRIGLFAPTTVALLLREGERLGRAHLTSKNVFVWLVRVESCDLTGRLHLLNWPSECVAPRHRRRGEGLILRELATSGEGAINSGGRPGDLARTMKGQNKQEPNSEGVPYFSVPRSHARVD